MEDINVDVNPGLIYDQYLQPEIEFPPGQIFGGVAITSINGITGPTVTFAGGTSGFSFVPGGTTITLLSPLTAKGDLYTHSSTAGVALAVGTNGFVLSANSGTATGLEWIANAVGTVTSVSVVTANGFAGTVATATTTPAITLSTTITGVLLGNGTAISAAASADIITALGYTPTNAAIVPNTAPTAGQILVGNAGNTAYAKQTVSGSGATITLASTGVITISGIANASLTNSSITINGTSVSLGGTRTLTLASADFVNQGTTTTVLHGNAAGNPSFAAVSLTADITGTLAEGNGGTNQSTYTQGDLLYASAANTLSKLVKNTTASRYLSNTGTSNNPAWAQVDLSNGVTGTVQAANFPTWTTPGYSSGDFTASSGTWTVDSGDVTTYEYVIFGKTMFLNIELVATSVSATPGSLKVAIPGSHTAASAVYFTTSVIDNGTTRTSNAEVTGAGATVVTFYATIFGGANWATSTNNTRVYFSGVFQIQ